MRSARVVVDCACSEGGAETSTKQSAAEQNATANREKRRLVCKIKSSRKIGWDLRAIGR
jgi:hypothetical protein